MPFPQFRYCADAKADNHDIVNGESTESRNMSENFRDMFARAKYIRIQEVIMRPIL